MALEVTRYLSKQVGWKRCVACSDFAKRPGTMWMGYTLTGADETIVCPECKGTGMIPRYKHYEILTGKEIDYERPGQTFVQLTDHTQ